MHMSRVGIAVCELSNFGDGQIKVEISWLGNINKYIRFAGKSEQFRKTIYSAGLEKASPAQETAMKTENILKSKAICLIMMAFLLVSCNRGGHGLIVDRPVGPETVSENNDAQFSITANNDPGITYAWACDPASAGTWANQTSAAATFHAGYVTEDTKVKIRVTVNSDKGQPLVREIEITIKNVGVEQPPIAKAKADPNLQSVGSPVQFSDDGSSDTDGGSIVKFEWDFTNDGGADAEGSSAEHVYNSPGTYQVQMRVTDDEGETDMLDEPLEIVIIPAPDNPVDITPWWLNFSGNDLCIDGTNAYAPAGANGLLIFDITDAANPVLLNRVDIPGGADFLAVSEGNACVTDGDSTLNIIDIDPPGSAYIAGSVDGMDNAGKLAVSGGYAYVGDSGNLRIIDIDPPGSAYIVASVETTCGVCDVTVSNGFAYVASYHTFYDYDFDEYYNVGSLDIIDVDPPDSAYLVNSVYIGGGGYCVAVSEGYAYVAEGSLEIVDIDPPDSAYVVDSINTPGYAVGVAVSDGYAYVADSDSGLQIVDIDPLDSACIVNSVDTPGSAISVSASGSYAYIRDSSSRLLGGNRIIDIDPPESAWIVNSVDTMYNPTCDIIISDGFAFSYTSDWVICGYRMGETLYSTKGYLDLIDIDKLMADLGNPDLSQIVSSIELYGSPYGLTMSNGYAYMSVSVYNECDRFSGTYQGIYEITPPDQLESVGGMEIPGDGGMVAVSGGYAYIADGEFGLDIVDIDPPDSSFIVKAVDTPGNAYYVTVSGGYAYVADDTPGLLIIDIDPPALAHIAGSVDGCDGASAVSGGYAYVADNESGLQVIDIDPPESAYIVKSVDTPGDANEVVVSGCYAYVADGSSGLQIIDINQPESAYIVSSVDTPGEADEVVVSGSYAYIADCGGGLRIIKLW